MAWHRITSWRGNFDWLRATGHLLLQTPDGNYDTTALKAEEFHALVHLLQTTTELYTDGSGKIVTAETPTGSLVRRQPTPPHAP